MEATILQFLESIRNPFLTVVLGVISLLGEAMIVGGVAILIFWLAPKRAGEQIIMTALTSFPLNALFKFIVHRPRPFVAGKVEYLKPPLADDLDLYASFPSGHTQSSGSLLFAAADTMKRIAALVLAAVLVLLVMLARMYFGAHYPSDVLAGLLFALIVALFWAIVFRHAYSARHIILLGLAALALIPCFFTPAHDYIQATGLLAGAALALAAGELTLPEPKPTPFPRRLWRVPVGGVILVAVLALSLLFPEGEAFSLLKWLLVSFFAGYAAPSAFLRLDI